MARPPTPRRAPRPVAAVIRALPLADDELAGELEVVDTGDVLAFASTADLLAALHAVVRDRLADR